MTVTIGSQCDVEQTTQRWTLVLPTITGNLDATAAGNITDSGAVSVAGTTKLAAGANDITLDNPDHLVGTVTVTSGHNVTLNNDTALDLGASTITGNLDA